MREVDDVRQNCSWVGKMYFPTNSKPALDMYLDDTKGNWLIYCIECDEFRTNFEIVRVLEIVK